MSIPSEEEQSRAERAQKLEFARLLFEAGPGADTYNIGFELFPNNPNRAVLIGGSWRADPVVIEELNRLRIQSVQEAETLPGHVELARNIWLKMQACLDPSDYVKLAELYAKVNGMIKKPEEPHKDNATVTTKVMLVAHYGSDGEWERQLAANQNQLQDDGLKEIAGSRVE